MTRAEFGRRVLKFEACWYFLLCAVVLPVAGFVLVGYHLTCVDRDIDMLVQYDAAEGKILI